MYFDETKEKSRNYCYQHYGVGPLPPSRSPPTSEEARLGPRDGCQILHLILNRFISQLINLSSPEIIRKRPFRNLGISASALSSAFKY